jgi:hypothetical protein
MFRAEVKYLTILFFSEPLFLNCLKHISFYKSLFHSIDQNFETSQRHTQKFLNSLVRLRTQVVQLPTTRCHSNLLSQSSSFAAVTLCVPSSWVLILCMFSGMCDFLITDVKELKFCFKFHILLSMHYNSVITIQTNKHPQFY